ncbi:MAG TPA: cation diffusion facilitator family transporter [Ignavibacteriales bacterium]|nr:cation diffusion facilitator family transporter [Ignavibacteriales bacterium]HOL81473.1 cation diffusion facilitator family transporter [Ignavibacteriales bacterium]HOM65371.1 cation diffusion facilitator family transporter [Ignavibacteriales bacterium]HPD67000.1 cation diffusion facilitator family transporter [Ignavibacteriales bacterium]HPP33600.1 cation diffusion facilitator family transporter [Ignavibacteriales bacterium]
MGHHHHNHNEVNLSSKKIFVTFLLNVSILVVQIIGGIISGSMALLSDALHNFSDALAIATTYFANKIAQKPKNLKYTFGYKRLELLAAIVNSTTLIVMGVLLIKESILLFGKERTIDTGIMIYVALFGVFANSLGTLLLSKDAKHNLNVKSAYLHLATDVISSIIVIAGALFIRFSGILWIDLLLSIILASYMIYSSWKIVLQTTRIFLMRAPVNIDLQAIILDVQNKFQLKNIHHAHCWQLDEKNTHIEFHAEYDSNNLEEITKTYDKIQDYLIEKYEITHLTIQAEYSCNCKKDLV